LGTRKLDLGEAASVLGVSREAVRRRAKRGTLDSERGDDGKLYVWVHDDHHTVEGGGFPHDDDRDELLEELRDRIRYLEEESRRKDHLLAAALERIPAIEPPETPETPTNEDAGFEPTAQPQPTTEGQQEPTSRPQEEQPRSWWRRWFGG
jgi:hypothetical protein